MNEWNKDFWHLVKLMIKLNHPHINTQLIQIAAKIADTMRAEREQRILLFTQQNQLPSSSQPSSVPASPFSSTDEEK